MRVSRKTQFCQTRELNPGLQVQSPVRYPLKALNILHFPDNSDSVLE